METLAGRVRVIILLVRDGPISSGLVQEEDLPLLFCGGIYKMSFPEPKKFFEPVLYPAPLTDCAPAAA